MLKDFPNNPASLKATLLRALALKGFDTECSILRQGELFISHEDHDNWNGGIDTWKIRISVSLEFYIEHETSIATYETNMLEIAHLFFKDDAHNNVEYVSLYPAAVSAEGHSDPQPELLAEIRFWKKGYLRLFISHCSSHKEEATSLRDALELYGISAFVAHEDIVPTKLWLGEIEKALDTMDGLVALLSEDFPKSLWCDQEVGVALGKNRVVVPVRLVLDPYGFMGQFQGIPGHGKSASVLATDIVNALLENPQTKLRMSSVVITGFIESTSYIASRTTIGVLEKIERISEEDAKRLVAAMRSNSQINEAFGVERRLKTLLKKHGHEQLLPEEKINF